MDFKALLTKIVKGLKWFFFSYIWLFVLLLVIDIVSKNLVVKTFAQGHDPITVIPNCLFINYTINTNAAFGFGLGSELTNRIFFIIVACIGTAIIAGLMVKKYDKLTPYVRACLMLLAVGALGNMVDRIFYKPEYLNWHSNGVVDWIQCHIVTEGFTFDWPLFNIADSCVVIGVFMLVVWLVIGEIKDAKARKAREKAQEAEAAIPTKQEIVDAEVNPAPSDSTAEENKEE